MNEKNDNICQNNFQYLSNNDIQVIEDTVKKYIFMYVLKLKSKKYNKLYPGLWNRIQQEFSTLIGIDENTSIPTKFYMLIHRMKELPKCEVCGNYVKNVINNNRGFSRTCSCKCGANLPDRNEKRIKTCQKKFGVDCYSQSKDFSIKCKQTKLEKYGDENYVNVEKAKQTKLEKYGDENYVNVEKAKQTKLEKYGDPGYNNRPKAEQTCIELYNVKNPHQLPEVVEKTKQTKLERHGDPGYNNFEQIKETKLEKYGDENFNNRPKAIQTCQEQWGVDNPSQVPEIKEKKENTFYTHYGVKCGFQAEEVKEKSRETKIKNHGDPNFNNRPKAIETCQKEFGKDWYFQTDEFEEKRLKTSQEKFGVDYYTQSEESKAKYNDPEFVQNMLNKQIETNQQKFNKDWYFQTDECKQKRLDKYKDKDWVKQLQEKINESKKKNNSWNKSKPEELYYEQLIELYGKEDIERQYNCERYPYNCDFYIKSLDLFIEIQCSHYHNYKPFDKNNPEHIKELEELKQKAANHPLNKSNTNQYYEIIKTWTIRDVEKREIAKKNNLNYLEIWKV